MDQYPDKPIMIVDDEESVLSSLTTTLKANGLNNIIECSSSREVMGIVESTELELILLDLTMPHVSGAELLFNIHDRHPQIPIIIVTGTNEVKTAVDCMKCGAFDYMVKAVEESRLVSGVNRAIEIRSLKRECQELKSRLITNKLTCPQAFASILTQNKTMHSIFLLVESIAKTNETVLITGETGVGKYLVTKAIHEVSQRTGPFMDINAAGLDDHMFSDDLFGHVKGAFTGADKDRSGIIDQAKGGTLLLDEIGDLTQTSQVKLLSLLDTRKYYPLGSDLAKRCESRIVVATNRNLHELMESGKFRKDLYYRLSTHEIKIPPLRDRKEDLPLLLDHFLGDAADELGRKKPLVPKELLPLLETYHFPGNIRELRSMIFDALARQKSDILSLAPFKVTIGESAKKSPSIRTEKLLIFGDKLPTLKQADELLIVEAMRRARGNQSLAAALIGISHQALNKRLLRRAVVDTEKSGRADRDNVDP